jgi:hypothetical protein
VFDAISTAVGRITRTLAGTRITHTPTSGVSTQAHARFDREYAEAFPNADAPIQETRPAVWLWLADYATVPIPGDTITVARDGSTYTIESMRPDGEGQSMALLVAT